MTRIPATPAPARAFLATATAFLAVGGCSSQQPRTLPERAPAPETLQPIATIQELMQTEVDASADNIWDAVETTTTASGETTKQPRTPEEWREIRRNAIVLIEAANLLTVAERKLSHTPFPAEAADALDSAEIERRIAANRDAFNQYAVALRQGAQSLLTAIDAQDPKAVVATGGVLDQICESCHMTFWYPNQVIPPFPSKGDPRYQRITVYPPR